MELKETQLASEEQRIILKQLAESVARPGCRFLEIGSWCGDSTTVIGRVAREFGGHLYCVDWWKGNVGTDLVDIASSEDVFTTFWKRITAEGLDDVVIPIRCRADLAPVILKENSFDFVFIDADHRYSQVFQDIHSYMTLVKRPGGLFCGHDCEGYISDFELDFLQKNKDTDFHQSVHCGVVLAVGQTFSDYSINYSIWSVRSTSGTEAWESTNLNFVGIDNQKMAMPTPISASLGYVIWRYGKRLYATPRHMSQVDIRSEAVRNNPEVKSADTLQGLEHLIGQGIDNLSACEINVNKWYRVVIVDTKTYVVPASLTEIDYTNMSVYIEQGSCAVFSTLYEAQLHISWLTQNILNRRYAVKEVTANAILLAIVKGIESIARRYFRKFKGLDYLKWQLHDIQISLFDRYAQVSELQTTPGINVSGQTSNPVLCEGGYNEFNIVEFEGRYYAFWQNAGSIDFHQGGLNQRLLELQKELRCFIGDSISEVKHLVDQLAVIKALDKLNQEIDVLQKEAIARDIQVRTLQSKLDEQDVYIEKLYSKTLDKSARIDLLYAEIAQWAARLSELQNDIRLRDLWIALLQKELSEWPRRIELMKKEIHSDHE
ncbi:MAG: class I SAM-dependent methyltransferase [Nitrospirae bacterium]|nr:class I SAM-dependent methyltransferase [Nitrospirota bacterium]